MPGLSPSGPPPLADQELWLSAAEANDAPTVAKMLGEGWAADFRGADGRWAAMAAVQGNAADALRLLIEAGCDVDGANGVGYSLAMWAASAGHTGCLRLLIDSGCDVDAQAARASPGAPGFSVASSAVSGDHAECLAMLIAAGCDIDHAFNEIEGERYPGHQGYTLLRQAVSENRTKCLPVLIQAGCDLQARPSRGITAAMLALGGGRVGEGVFDMLLAAGYDMDVQDGNGWADAHWAILAGMPELLGKLVERGCGIELRDGLGRTPALFAAELCDAGCLVVLLRAGCDPVVVDTRGVGLMQAAIEAEEAESVGMGLCVGLIQSALDAREIEASALPGVSTHRARVRRM